MNVQFSLNDILSLLSIVVAVVAGIKAIQFLFSQTLLSQVKTQVDANTKHLNEDFEKFKTIERRLNAIDHRLDEAEKSRDAEVRGLTESLNIIGTSVASILNHMIDGNGITEMKEERDRLIGHFINK